MAPDTSVCAVGSSLQKILAYILFIEIVADSMYFLFRIISFNVFFIFYFP